MAASLLPLLVLQVLHVLVTGKGDAGLQDFLRLPSDSGPNSGDGVGTRWAVLIAGSNGYYNYRHQADVCHAYQIMKKGGLKDENIIVFMYDDIAHNPDNPRPGVIINHPSGGDVYAGVPKDYTGTEVNAKNFLAVLLGDRSGVTGGSGKVVDSGPADHIFVYYSDHGGPGVLGMPSGDYLYAKDLVDTLKKKHDSGNGYKSMVFYMEACESGSIFEGLLPSDIAVYATTASNAEESSWGTYCPGDEKGSPPPEFDTCLGDLYSVAWMEDSDAHDLRSESVKQQYEVVKQRTAGTQDTLGSHVMQYGDMKQSEQSLYAFIGTNPNPKPFFSTGASSSSSSRTNQRDADLVYFWQKFRKAADGTPEKMEAEKRLLQVMARRSQLDTSMDLILKLHGDGAHPSPSPSRSRPEESDWDWDCLKSMVATYQQHCGPLGQYGMKHMRSLANICSAGVDTEQMAKVAAQACAAVVHSDDAYCY